jgi:hypothetical protein
MAILSSPAPAGLAERAAVEASSAAAGALEAEAVFGGELGATPSAAEPMPIYSIPLDVLASGSPSLEMAEQHGWRVLTRDNSGWRVVDYAGREPARPASAIRGSRPAELLLQAGIRAAERDDGDATYEPRILEIGRLGFSALWLHSEEAPDRLYTLEDDPRERTTEDLLAELAPRARRRLDSAARRGMSGDALSNELGG